MHILPKRRLRSLLLGYWCDMIRVTLSRLGLVSTTAAQTASLHLPYRTVMQCTGLQTNHLQGLGGLFHPGCSPESWLSIRDNINYVCNYSSLPEAVLQRQTHQSFDLQSKWEERKDCVQSQQTVALHLTANLSINTVTSCIQYSWCSHCNDGIGTCLANSEWVSLE